MATEYKFLGAEDLSQPTEALYLEGSVVNPPADEKIIRKGDVVSLNDDELAAYKASGLKFRKASEKDLDSEDESDEDKSAADQQKAQADSQVASGAQGPAATLANDNTPGGRSLKGKN